MRKLSSTFVAILGGLAALLAGACNGKGASTSDGSGTGGTGGASGSSLFPITLAPSATGVVDDVRSGVMGAWYAYGDSVGSGANAASTDFADSDCAKGGYTMSQCSQITTPTPGQPFPPDVTGAMCTQGIAAKVLMSTTGTRPTIRRSGAPELLSISTTRAATLARRRGIST